MRVPADYVDVEQESSSDSEKDDIDSDKLGIHRKSGNEIIDSDDLSEDGGDGSLDEDEIDQMLEDDYMDVDEDGEGEGEWESCSGEEEEIDGEEEKDGEGDE